MKTSEKFFHAMIRTNGEPYLCDTTELCEEIDNILQDAQGEVHTDNEDDFWELKEQLDLNNGEKVDKIYVYHISADRYTGEILVCYEPDWDWNDWKC